MATEDIESHYHDNEMKFRQPGYIEREPTLGVFKEPVQMLDANDPCTERPSVGYRSHEDGTCWSDEHKSTVGNRFSTGNRAHELIIGRRHHHRLKRN